MSRYFEILSRNSDRFRDIKSEFRDAKSIFRKSKSKVRVTKLKFRNGLNTLPSRLDSHYIRNENLLSFFHFDF